MNHKLSLTMLAIGLSSVAFTSHAAETSVNDNISYNFIEAGIGKGKTKLRTENRTFEFETNTMGVTLSHKIHEGAYIKLSSLRARTDDTDAENGMLISLDDTDTQTNALLGFYFPLDYNFHLIAEAGANHARSKSSLTFKPYNIKASTKNTDTDFMWRVGFRSSWSSSFEMNANYFKSDNTSGWTINGPIMLSKNLGLDIHYTQTKNTDPDRKNKAKVMGASLRYQF